MKYLTLALCLYTSVAWAQQAQSPDPAFLQAALNALQVQRNAANDNSAALEAKLNLVTNELAKANTKIKELESKSEVKEPDK